MAFKPSELVGKKREKTETERQQPPEMEGGGRGNEESHPGFKAVQSKIAGERGVGKERAGAILAAATRRASPAAKRANPNLKRVKG